MNFCRLPPESERATARGPPALTLKRAMMPAACCSSCRTPNPAAGPARVTNASCRVSSRLCARPSVGTAPRPSRSSGTKCKPSLTPGTGMQGAGIGAGNPDAARRARTSSPDRAYSSSFWPLPDTPAMPTTSPALHLQGHMPCRSTPNWSALRQIQALHLQHRRAGLLPAGARAAAARRRSSGATARHWSLRPGCSTPVTRPPRSTVQAVHSSRISCSLWLMYKMLQPSAANLLQHHEQLLDRLRRQHRGGLIQNQQLRVRSAGRG